MIEYSILMTRAHSELTNGDLDIVSNKGADERNFKKVYLHTPELQRKNSDDYVYKHFRLCDVH